MVNIPDYNNTQRVKPSDIIKRYKQSNQLGKTAVFYPSTRTVGDKENIADIEDFWERTSKSAEALKKGDITFRDVLREVPEATKDTVVGISDTFAPAITNFFKTTGSILGEGLAYAVDENVRTQYKAGNLDVLPTITATTQADLAKYTFAAGLETAIFRSFPNAIKTTLMRRGGIGALQGAGFAISEGLAKDKSPEEIMKNMALYGVSGSVLTAVSPYLIPLLKSEVTHMPADLKNLFKAVDAAKSQEASRKLAINSLQHQPTKVPISTPNSRYQAYLRSQGYEPYVPDVELPEIQMGSKGSPVSDLPSIQMGEPSPSKIGPYTYVPEKPVTVTPETSNAVAKAAEVIPEPKAQPKPSVEVPEGSTVTKVPGQQLPVGTGDKAVSRLEARMRGAAQNLSDAEISEMGLATYNKMTKSDQLARAARFVTDDFDTALKVARGEKAPPNDLLRNAVTLAVGEHAALSGDPALLLQASKALRSTSLQASRFGQEISILSEADPDNIVGVINEIFEARTQRAARKTLGKNLNAKDSLSNISKEVDKTVKAAQQKIKPEIKLEEAQKFLDDIMC